MSKPIIGKLHKPYKRAYLEGCKVRLRRKCWLSAHKYAEISQCCRTLPNK